MGSREITSVANRYADGIEFFEMLLTVRRRMRMTDDFVAEKRVWSEDARPGLKRHKLRSTNKTDAIREARRWEASLPSSAYDTGPVQVRSGFDLITEGHRATRYED